MLQDDHLLEGNSKMILQTDIKIENNSDFIFGDNFKQIQNQIVTDCQLWFGGD